MRKRKTLKNNMIGFLWKRKNISANNKVWFQFFDFVFAWLTLPMMTAESYVVKTSSVALFLLLEETLVLHG